MECQYSFSNPTEKRASSFGSFSIFLGLTIQITNKESVADLYGTSTYIGGGRIDLVSIARANDLNDKDVEGIKVQLIGLAIDALDIADIHVSQSWTQKAHYQFPNITTDYPQVLQYNTKQSSNYKLSRHKNTRKKVRTNSCFVYFSY